MLIYTYVIDIVQFLLQQHNANSHINDFFDCSTLNMAIQSQNPLILNAVTQSLKIDTQQPLQQPILRDYTKIQFGNDKQQQTIKVYGPELGKNWGELSDPRYIAFIPKEWFVHNMEVKGLQ